MKLAEDGLVDFEEAGRVLGGISPKTVTRLIAKGELPTPVNVTRKPMLYSSDLQHYLAKLKRNQRGVTE